MNNKNSESEPDLIFKDSSFSDANPSPSAIL